MVNQRIRQQFRDSLHLLDEGGLCFEDRLERGIFTILQTKIDRVRIELGERQVRILLPKGFKTGPMSGEHIHRRFHIAPVYQSKISAALDRIPSRIYWRD